MTLDDLKKHYRNAFDFEKRTGMSHVNWPNWERKGYIPIATQVKLEKLTEGYFKADLNDVGGLE